MENRRKDERPYRRTKADLRNNALRRCDGQGSVICRGTLTPTIYISSRPWKFSSRHRGKRAPRQIERVSVDGIWTMEYG